MKCRRCKAEALEGKRFCEYHLLYKALDYRKRNEHRDRYQSKYAAECEPEPARRVMLYWTLRATV